MSDRTPVALVVHGHFYQPPRENPWTDEVPPEPDAAPMRDWNARIHAECYRANAYARLYGPDDRVSAIVNNYDRVSFNFGPTLARWIARHDPRTWNRIRAADADQQRRLGAGGALAQVWGHPITPLCSPRDRRTQILWGLQDFRRRFSRRAQGMWLPETAVDAPTLEALIDAGVAFTILAPEQIAAVRPPGEPWTKVDRDSLDTGRLYSWPSSSKPGRSIALGVFDGPLSREIAFGSATRDAATFLQKVAASAARSAVTTRRLVLAASDGELYGHHKKFADLTLAYATRIGAPAQSMAVTNLGEFLAASPPSWEAELAKGPHGEGTAWSCGHGLGRWRRHCGCAMRSPSDSGWSQAWRAPLREAIDLLRDRAAALYEDAGGDLFSDPSGVRDAYGTVIDDPPPIRGALLRKHGRPRLRRAHGSVLRRAHTLIEMQRSALLMYASCGWFFDDISGLESALVLRRAAHLMDLWAGLGSRPPRKELLETLAQARSNVPSAGTGADVFRRLGRDRITPAAAVARAALEDLAGGGESRAHRSGTGYDVSLGERSHRRQARGTALVAHRRSGDETRLTYAARYDGAARFEAVVAGQRFGLDDLDEAAARPLRLAALERLAARPPSVATCRLALDLAGPLGAAGSAGAEPLRASLFRLLLGLLEARAPARFDKASLAIAQELADRIDLQAGANQAHLAEELVWETLAYTQARRASAPKALRALAKRLGLAT